MPCEGKRQVREVVRMYLRLICPYIYLLDFASVGHANEHASAHYPVAIFADADALARLLELEIL